LIGEAQTTTGRRVIAFYSTQGEYGCFSNFAASPFALGGKGWPTLEHYFQAQKFAGTEHEEAIRRARSPMVAARMGRSRQRPLRPDWERAKDDVMLAGLRAKFGQHADIRAVLLGTGDALLLEHTRKDRYWADGGDGTGENMLGTLLMRVREELRAAG
jgi:N-glycosidase YbiA